MAIENHIDGAVLGRRQFLQAGTAALVVPFSFALASGPAGATGLAAPVQVGAYIRINPDNTVTVAIGSTEMGQGIMTGLAQLAADELKLHWDQVRAEHAPAAAAYANPLFGLQLTGGSTSTMGWYTPMRTAAAIVGVVLTRAAKQQAGGNWKIKAGGKLTSGGNTLLFADVAETAATLSIPTSATVTGGKRFIGKAMPRLDIAAKVDGSAQFGLDVRLDGMRYAAIAHCPTMGGKVASLPSAPSGTTLVNLGNAVGVVADDTWSAIRAARSVASRVNWTLPADLNAVDTDALYAAAQALTRSTTAQKFVAEKVGKVALGTAAKRLDQTYTLPFLAHAAMEVLNCTVSLTADACEIWAPTQGQAFVAPTAAAITGLTPDKITLHTTFAGGGFGRKFETDFVAQAVTIAKAIGAPVKLTWSREEDFANDKYRPCAAIRVRAGLDADGGIQALVYRNVSASINVQRGTVQGSNPEDTGAVAGAVKLPYRIGGRRIEFVPLLPCDIPLGYWRSVGESYNTFAVESAIDELAVLAGKDPLEFRKGLVDGQDDRALGVLTAVETLSGWNSPAPAGHARGVAMLKGFGSYIALVAEIALDGSGNISPKTMSIAVDCGVAVNPGSIEAQMQGGIAMGIASSMWHDARFVKGVAQVKNYNRYAFMHVRQMPQIRTTIVDSQANPGGIGETGVPCVAPALANAYAALTGTRLRNLPFYPGVTMHES